MFIVILTIILFILILAWFYTLKKDFYSFKAVTVLSFTLYFLVYICCLMLEVFTANNAINCFKFLTCIVSVLIIILGILVLISNIFLIKHEGFRLKRLIGLQVIITGAVSLVLDGVPVINCLLAFFECNLISFLIMAYLAVIRKITYDKDVVIILGCLISKNGGLLPLLKARTNKAIRFAWDQEIATGKMVKYVPSGGQGANEVISEGSAMEFYLLTHGAEKYEIYTEKKSRNTYENMLFSKEIIDRNFDDARVAFATTNFHVYRSGILAKKVGLNAEGISSSTKWYFWPAAVIREYVAYLKMFVKENILISVIIVAVNLLMMFFGI